MPHKILFRLSAIFAFWAVILNIAVLTYSLFAWRGVSVVQTQSGLQVIKNPIYKGEIFPQTLAIIALLAICLACLVCACTKRTNKTACLLVIASAVSAIVFLVCVQFYSWYLIYNLSTAFNPLMGFPFASNYLDALMYVQFLLSPTLSILLGFLSIKNPTD